MRDKLLHIFQETYRELAPRAALPELQVDFYPFANINNTIRLRRGKVLVRVSDLLEGAPEAVLRSLAHILLAKMYRKPVQPAHATRYRRHVFGHDLTAKAHLIRQVRGRKRIVSAQGDTYDLEGIFQELNRRYFHGLMAQPRLTWSRDHARRSLGHYDPGHNAIVVSRAFDDHRVPRYALEYLLYHEMLHLKHPVRLQGSRRCVHSAEFRREEELFPRLEAAKRFLKHW